MTKEYKRRQDSEDGDRGNSRDRRDLGRETFFNYLDVKQLQRYVNPYGQIESRSKTRLSEKQQKHLARAIKRARHLALLPFVAK